MAVDEKAWSGRRVLVTGASGIIGSWLVKELLAACADVFGLVLDVDPGSELAVSGDLERLRIVDGRLEQFRQVESAIRTNSIDTVFHLGAQTLVERAQHEPLETWETNVRGTYHVLEACRLNADRVRCIVVASSDKAYGEAESGAYTEASPLAARNPYDVSKACGDLLARSYHHSYRLPVTVARSGNVYGGGDLNWSRLVPGTIRACLRNERPVIRSDGSYVRDYVYVADAARAYLLLAEHVDDDGIQGTAFNFGTGVPTTVLELVSKILDLTGSRCLEPEILDTAQGEIHHQVVSSERASSMLSWRPSFGLEDGLRETIAWYRAHAP